MFLSESEVREFTGRQRHHAQRKILAQMGVKFRVRPDGRPMVLRAHVDSMMGAKSESAPPEPDWEAMDAAASAKSR